jgi:hypothetical protein
MKKRIINYLFKKLIRTDFVDMSDMDRLRAYQRMNDRRIVELFKARYTNNLVAHLLAKGDEKEQMKGRVYEDLDILNSIENIEEHLLKINEYTEQQKEKRSILKSFKNKLLNHEILKKQR